MANEEQLPWEMTEEILYRVPPKSLARFRAVSKQWNTLFSDKKFISNHKETFRFILVTESKIYSVSVSPKIEVRELTSDIQKPRSLVGCNEFLLCDMNRGALVLNPWLGQTRLIEPDVDQLMPEFHGIGYEYDDKEKLKKSGYKTLSSYWKMPERTPLLKSHAFGSHACKNRTLEPGARNSTKKRRYVNLRLVTKGVSLHGTLYWVSFFPDTSIFLFDFSNDMVVEYCYVPCGENHDGDALALEVFEGDRFSLLKQCHLTKKIEVWVTKNKISKLCGRDVEWMKFMQVSTLNLPDLVQTGSNSQPSYFIEDKKLVVCSYDENGRAWIYVVGESGWISKIQLDSVVDPWPLHCTCFPSWTMIPRVEREDVELQV